MIRKSFLNNGLSVSATVIACGLFSAGIASAQVQVISNATKGIDVCSQQVKQKAARPIERAKTVTTEFTRFVSAGAKCPRGFTKVATLTTPASISNVIQNFLIENRETLVGKQGLSGAVGAPGAAGANGLNGAAGAPGAQGLKGDKGDKGDIGAAGAAGLAGAPGTAADMTVVNGINGRVMLLEIHNQNNTIPRLGAIENVLRDPITLLPIDGLGGRLTAVEKYANDIDNARQGNELELFRRVDAADQTINLVDSDRQLRERLLGERIDGVSTNVNGVDTRLNMLEVQNHTYSLPSIGLLLAARNRQDGAVQSGFGQKLANPLVDTNGLADFPCVNTFLGHAAVTALNGIVINNVPGIYNVTIYGQQRDNATTGNFRSAFRLSGNTAPAEVATFGVISSQGNHEKDSFNVSAFVTADASGAIKLQRMCATSGTAGEQIFGVTWHRIGG